jgi:6,7-dimethyl-8-ribityllumazine synthase
MTNRPARLGFVVTDFNRDFTHMTGMEVDEDAQFFDATVPASIPVLGAYDVPLFVQKSLKKLNIGAFVTIVCVIEGATNHDRIVVQNETWTIFDSSHEFDEQVTFGISRLGTTKFGTGGCIEYGKQVAESDAKMTWWFEE